MASQRGHVRTDISRPHKQFMFVPHDEHKGRCKSSARRDMNRHVQRNSRQVASSHRDIPLRYQLCFRASDWGMPYIPRASAQARHSLAPSSESESSSEGTIGSPTPSLSLSPCDDPREAASVQFYQHVVSGQLSGAITSAFWERYVLQRLQQQPVIKQALVALSLAYREICDTSQQNHPGSINIPTPAYQATGKAIGCLRSYLQNERHPAHDVVLTCAVLLFALEKTRGERENSLRHLDNAIAIFKSWTEDLQLRIIPPEYEVLRSVITLLDGNACIEDTAREQLCEMRISEPSADLDDIRFGSIEDMRDDLKIRVCHPLTKLMSRCRDISAADLQEFPPDALQEKTRLERELSRWRAAFDHFTWDRSSIREPRGEPTWSPQEEITILTVEIHYLIVKCFLLEAIAKSPADANAWDQHANQVLTMGERALELLRRLHGSFQDPLDGRQRAMVITYAQSLPLFAQQTTLLNARGKAMRLYAGLEQYTRVIAICPGLRATERFREAGTGAPKFSPTAALLLTLGSRS